MTTGNEATPGTDGGITPSNEPVDTGSIDNISSHLSFEPDPNAAVETDPNNPAPDPAAEGDGRFQPRIDELTKKLAEKEAEAQRAYQFEMMIASNPTMLAEYQRLQGITPGNAPAQQPGQQPGQHPGQQPAQQNAPMELPQWDPDYPEEYLGAFFHNEAQAFVAETKILDRLQQLEQFANHQTDIFYQQQQEQLNTRLQNLIYQEMPSAKDDKLQATMINTVYRDAVAQMKSYRLPNGQYYQPSLKDFEDAAMHAVKTAKEYFTQLPQAAQPAPGMQPQQPQRPFAETGGNMVSPRPAGTGSIADAISAHLNLVK